MKRLLLTIEEATCPYRCRYCFANFSQYKSPITLEHAEAHPELLADVDFIYPACDVDLFALCDGLNILTRAAALRRSISVSTKAVISELDARVLLKLDEDLRRYGLFLKISISFSTKDHIATIEPGASSFIERVTSLKILGEHDIHTCAILKPILPGIETSEYLEMLEAFCGVTQNIVVGDLYLDKKGNHLGNEHYDAKLRRVNWAVNSPLWPVAAAAEKREAIIHRAEALEFSVFESDLDLLIALLALRRNEWVEFGSGSGRRKEWYATRPTQASSFCKTPRYRYGPCKRKMLQTASRSHRACGDL